MLFVTFKAFPVNDANSLNVEMTQNVFLRKNTMYSV